VSLICADVHDCRRWAGVKLFGGDNTPFVGRTGRADVLGLQERILIVDFRARARIPGQRHRRRRRRSKPAVAPAAPNRDDLFLRSSPATVALVLSQAPAPGAALG